MTAARVAASIEFARGEIHLRLDLPDVPFVALTGPNGAGKTSALRCLAGLEQAAHVEWPDGEPASRGYLPQRVMLYPAMSLADNIASSMRFAGLSKASITERTAELLDLVALGPDDEPAVVRARSVKSDLCRSRSKQIAPYPSKGLYKSSGIRLKQGVISWEGVIE